MPSRHTHHHHHYHPKKHHKHHHHHHHRNQIEETYYSADDEQPQPWWHLSRRALIIGGVVAVMLVALTIGLCVGLTLNKSSGTNNQGPYLPGSPFGVPQSGAVFKLDAIQPASPALRRLRQLH